MTDTPETDDLARGNHVVPTTFAEQLERERDEARELHRNALREREATEKEVDAMLERAQKAESERDEAREEIEMLGIRYAAAEMHHETNMQEVTEQRDNAIEMGNRTRNNSGEIIASQVVENIMLTQQRDRLAENLEQALNATVLNHRNDRWHIDAEHSLQLIKTK